MGAARLDRRFGVASPLGHFNIVGTKGRLPAIDVRKRRLCAILAIRQVILSHKGEAETHAPMVAGQWLTR